MDDVGCVNSVDGETERELRAFIGASHPVACMIQFLHSCRLPCSSRPCRTPMMTVTKALQTQTHHVSRLSGSCARYKKTTRATECNVGECDNNGERSIEYRACNLFFFYTKHVSSADCVMMETNDMAHSRDNNKRNM